jgi:TonB family protein
VTRSRNRLWRASALSLLGHAALLLLVVRSAQVTAFDAGPEGTLWADVAAAAASPTWVDLRSAAEVLPSPEPAAETFPQADQARSVTAESAPQRGNTEARQSPAPDSGEGGGRQSPLAFRRDSSTLRTRAADNASAYQIAHERTGSRSASPQPVRQEPTVGIGDSSRTRRRRAADSPSPRETLPEDPDGVFDPQVTLQAGASQQSDTGRDLARGDGPLAADQGQRRFDIDVPGAAQDAQAARAASSEAHPGRLELSSPAVSGPGSEGRGPAEAPGVVPRPTPGTDPAVRGAARETPFGADLQQSAAEREYQRALGEIQRKVSRTLRFPRRLALELEQGETVVRFVLRPDGRIEGAVRIVKSAGFEEFDAEAVSAVTRAAPFPPMNRQFTISMPISFDNPLVR